MDVEFARRQMIEQQVRAWRVLDDRVLGAMAQVRRELFVPPEVRELAFADTSIPLAHGQSMFAPKVEGRVLQALELDDADEVLEVGTGSGYLAACLARLAGAVRSVEIFPDLSARASENLRASGVGRVTVTGCCRLPPSPRWQALATPFSRAPAACRTASTHRSMAGSAPKTCPRKLSRTARAWQPLWA